MKMPHSPHYDATINLLQDPYRYIGRQCAALKSPVFQTRLMLQNAICMTGAEASQLFYDTSFFQRAGAAPFRLKATLFGLGGVQGLDDGQHRHRKQLFLLLMTDERIQQLVDLFEHHWRREIQHTPKERPVRLYEQFQSVLCRAATEWAGILIPESEQLQWQRQMTAMYDQAGAIGWRHWQARWLRQKAQQRLVNLIDQLRMANGPKAEKTAVELFANFRDVDGQLLSSRTVAVELLNVVRPITAVSVYLTFVALALHQHAACRDKFVSQDIEYKKWFVQEIRRHSPFFPALVASVRKTFEWKSYQFPSGRRVLLDIYGTNHDPQVWNEPNHFCPDRFATEEPTPFNFIPQGGGDVTTGHRCPGEAIATALISRTAELISRDCPYRVPKQDVEIDFSRLPAVPRSRMIVEFC